MIFCIFSRCSSKRHALALRWISRQRYGPSLCDRKVVGEPLFLIFREPDDQDREAQGFRSKLYFCKLSIRAGLFSHGNISAPLIWPIYHIGRYYSIQHPITTRFSGRRIMAGGECHLNTGAEATCATNCSNKTDQAELGSLCESFSSAGKATNIVWHECKVKKEERQKLLGQKGCVIWITGLSGSGKSTLACTLDHALLKRGNISYVIDGDNVRHGLNKNLGFCAEDRTENIRRVGEVAKLFVDAGFICIASLISPYKKDRNAIRQLLHPGEFIEVHMNFPVSLCEERDPKGLYKLARAGKIKGFTGIDDPYEAPTNCEVVMQLIGGKCPTPAEMACLLITYMEERSILGPSRQV